MLASVYIITALYYFFQLKSGTGFDPNANEDIQYIYRDCLKISQFQNPYLLIEGRSLKFNELKYTTYFPGFFIIGAIPIWLGVSDFASWLEIWRVVSGLSHICIGLLILYATRELDFIFSLLLLSLWSMSRWSLYAASSGQIDIFAAVPLCLAVLLFNKNKYTSCALAIGVSLSLKQVALPVLPLFFIAVLRESDFQTALKFIIKALSLPFCLCLPYIISNYGAFKDSILFSATRDPVSHLFNANFDQLFGFDGSIGKFAFLLAILSTSVLLYRHRFSLIVSVFLVFFSWVSLMHVHFLQYNVWPFSMALLAAAELANTGLQRFKKAGA